MSEIKERFLFSESLVISILPCILLLNLGANFYTDWPNHLWMIGYFGAYFREHLSFPEMFNTYQYIGMPSPIFYGFGFYRFFGLLTWLLTPSISVRIITFLFFTIQHFVTLITLLKLRLPRWFSSSISMMITLSIYPLTNLYNRSALTEFFATIALSIAVCILFLVLLESRSYKRLWLLCTFTLFFTFSCLTHPITAIWGSILLTLFFIPFIFLIWKDLPRKVELLKYGTLACISILLILSPWIYANIIFLGKLQISKNISPVLFFPDSIDWIWTRISPIPFDIRTLREPLHNISTPFLDAQSNIFLVGMWILFLTTNSSILFLNNNAISYRALLLIFITFTFLLWLLFLKVSIDPTLIQRTPSLLRMIQYAYRFVTYQNLSALCGIIGFAFLIRQNAYFKNGQRLPKFITAVLVLIACCSFGVKIYHSCAIRTVNIEQILATRESRNSTLSIPRTFYGSYDYVTLSKFELIDSRKLQGSKALQFQPQNNLEFGSVPGLEVTTDHAGWYKTNVQPFLWNHLLIDGQVIQNQKYTYDKGSPIFVIFLPKGKSYVLYSTNFPTEWSWLDRVSLGTSLLIIFFLINFRMISYLRLLTKNSFDRNMIIF